MSLYGGRIDVLPLDRRPAWNWRSLPRHQLKVCATACKYFLLLRWFGLHVLPRSGNYRRGHDILLRDRSLPSVNLRSMLFSPRLGYSKHASLDRVHHGLILSLPRQPSILDGRIQETTGVDVAHWCRPIHLYRVVRSYWLFPAVRSSRLLGYPYRDRRSRQLPRCWATYRFASSWRSIGWSRDLESLLCSTRACTSPDHRHPDAKPLPVSPHYSLEANSAIDPKARQRRLTSEIALWR